MVRGRALWKTTSYEQYFFWRHSRQHWSCHSIFVDSFKQISLTEIFKTILPSYEYITKNLKDL